MNRSPLQWVPTGYFAMAMGYMMLTSVTSIMFKNLGMDNGRAAQYASMLILAYTIKPLFAPVVEMYRTKKFFVLVAQMLLGLGFGAVALVMAMPDSMALMMALFWIMSFIGATMDIASDGVYVTSLSARSQSLYCGVQSLSWNIGPVVASGVLVYLSGRLHSDYGMDWLGAWRIVFLAAFILRDAFKTFFEKRGVWTMVAFALLYRVSIGLLEKIGPFFMVDPVEKGGLGMSNELLGIVYGTYGLLAVLAGSLAGGWYVARRGLKPVLFQLCCVLNVPIATFLLMAIYQPSSLWVIGAGVVVEKFSFGFGAVGFMIYLMQQLAPGKYTTTHYAFGTGLMGLCGMVTGMVSGHLQQAMGYVSYFWLVMAATVPSFIVTWYAPFHHEEQGAVAEPDMEERMAG